MSETWKQRVLLVVRAALWAGALGLATRLSAQDCNCNSRADSLDIAEGRSSDCNRNGIPDECELIPQTRFAPAAVIERPGNSPTSIVIIELGSDGLPDLAAGSSDSESITLLENSGGRLLGGGRELRVGAAVRSLAAADLDGDGRDDLAAATPFAVLVLLAGEDGSFRERRQVPVHSDPAIIAAGDLDGDGAIDLVTANALIDNPAAGNVSVLINEGGGAFRLQANYAAGSGHTALVIQDLDGDGTLDVAAAGLLSKDVSILQNRGGGALSPAESLAVGFGLEALAAGDFDRDGSVDLVAVGSKSLVLLRNDGRAGFFEAATLPLGASGILARDLDGDGALDLALAADDSAVRILYHAGESGFSAPMSFVSACAEPALAGADLDGDGAVDLALAGIGATFLRSSGCVAVLWNDAGRLFDAPQRLDPPRSESDIIAADLNLDGRPDLLVPGGSTRAYHNRGRGVFDSFEVWPAVRDNVIVADLDGDSSPDLAATSGCLWVAWSEGTDSFVSRRCFDMAAGVTFSALVAADLDGDGDLDLAGASISTGEVHIYANAGAREFELTAKIPVGSDPARLLAGRPRWRWAGGPGNGSAQQLALEEPRRALEPGFARIRERAAGEHGAPALGVEGRGCRRGRPPGPCFSAAGVRAPFELCVDHSEPRRAEIWRSPASPGEKGRLRVRRLQVAGALRPGCGRRSRRGDRDPVGTGGAK
jgi:hypothetical protein